MKDQYGRTGQEFLEEMFEYTYCECCGHDIEDHTPVPLFFDSAEVPLWFAYCNKEPKEE